MNELCLSQISKLILKSIPSTCHSRNSGNPDKHLSQRQSSYPVINHPWIPALRFTTAGMTNRCYSFCVL